MSSIEISSDLVERMEKEEILTGLGVYGPEASKLLDMVQRGKRLCAIIHSSAEKCSLPTELQGPAPFTRSISPNDLKYVAKIFEKNTHEGCESSPTVELTDDGQTRALCRLRLHVEAVQVLEYLGKFINNSVEETSKYYDFLVKLPKEIYDKLKAITADYIRGPEIYSIDDQLVKLTEMVALASGQEAATVFSGIGYRLILHRVAMETHQSLEKFIHSPLVKSLPPSVVFLRSHEEILEDIVRLWYAPRARFNSMIPKEDVETYERVDNLHVRIIDIPEKKHCFLKICTWHGESHGLEDALKNVRKTDHMAIISSSILAMSAQAGGSFLSSAFADHETSNRTSKWALDFVEAAMLAGFGLTIGGMGIRRVKPEISGFLIKSGAIATAWAFIASLAIPLSSVVAWTVGPIAAGFVAASIGLA